MRSMTGFGSGAASLGEGQVRVEIRALNHRHQDVRVRLGTELAECSFFLEDLARKTLGRGRFDLHGNLDGAGPGHVEYDLEKLKTLYVALRDLGAILEPQTPIAISSLALLPGMVTTRGRNRSQVEAALEAAFRAASKELEQMRSREGQYLKDEMTRLLSGVQERLDGVETRAQTASLRHRDRLKMRIKELLLGSELTSERLEQEVALLAEKADVTEEIARLRSHIHQLLTWFESEEPHGRKFDFLLQEMNREVNTLGSKSHDEELTMFVIDLKSDLEKLREQVQNIE
jgi:uncharacterized protein (TIGR00255 family)